MGEVTIGVAYAGWRNSRCIPRPTYCSFSIDPPQVDPAIATCTGSGQNSGCPDSSASLPPSSTAVYRWCIVWISSTVDGGRSFRKTPPSISDWMMLRLTSFARFGWGLNIQLAGHQVTGFHGSLQAPFHQKPEAEGHDL